MLKKEGKQTKKNKNLGKARYKRNSPKYTVGNRDINENAPLENISANKKAGRREKKT